MIKAGKYTLIGWKILFLFKVFSSLGTLQLQCMHATNIWLVQASLVTTYLGTKKSNDASSFVTLDINNNNKSNYLPHGGGARWNCLPTSDRTWSFLCMTLIWEERWRGAKRASFAFCNNKNTRMPSIRNTHMGTCFRVFRVPGPLGIEREGSLRKWEFGPEQNQIFSWRTNAHSAAERSLHIDTLEDQQNMSV